MTLRGGGLVAAERFHAQDVVRDRVIRAETERGLGLADHVRAAPLLLRLHRSRQMLFDRRHGAQMRAVWPGGQATPCGRPRLCPQAG